uniref:Small ribosomal subunit protein uS15 n=1 Tax=Salmo trutta TaxID=8032 RepID=A0A674AKF4_SALTR
SVPKCNIFLLEIQCLLENSGLWLSTQEHLTSFPHTDTKSFQSGGSPLFLYRHHGSHACSRWLKLASDDVKEQIFKLAKKGLTPSQIGVILRDSHGVAQVRFVTGNKILRILKTKGLAPDLPEDLYHLIKKAVAVRKHLERNRKDKDAKFRLILTESRIHRLARYYKTRRVLAPNWKYESSTASALVA